MTTWVDTTLGALGTTVRGVSYDPASDLSENASSHTAQLLRANNVQDGVIVFNDVQYVRRSRVRADQFLRSNDILICAANGSKRLVGKAGRFTSMDGIFTFGAFMMVYRPDARKVEPAFVAQIFNSHAYRMWVELLLAGSSINNLNRTAIEDLVIGLPDRVEQQLIATALQDSDELVTALESLVVKKKRIKQGIMQTLLTGNTRLPGFTDDWISTRLGALGSTYGGLVGKAGEDFGNGSGRYVTFVEVMRDARIRGTDLAAVVLKPGERQNEVRRGDVLFNGSSETPEEVALASVVDFDYPRVMLNSFCFGYRPSGAAQVDPLFLAYYFRAAPGRALVASLAQGSTRYNIAKSKLLNAPLSLPGVEEQKAIAQVIREVDDEIEALERRIKSVRAIKNGMMQELLTGRTRLRVESAA